MKPLQARIVTAAVLGSFLAVCAAAHLRAESQKPKPAESLTAWKYPGAETYESCALGQTNVPEHGLRQSTSADMEVVCKYYANRINWDAGDPDSWQVFEHAILQTLYANGATGGGDLLRNTGQKKPNSALMVVHQVAQTIVIQMERRTDKPGTDILIVSDDH